MKIRTTSMMRHMLAALLLVAASTAGRAEVRLDRNQERVTLKAVDLNRELVAYLSRPAGEEPKPAVALTRSDIVAVIAGSATAALLRLAGFTG